MHALTRRFIDALRWLPGLLLILAVVVLSRVLPLSGLTAEERAEASNAWREHGFTVAVVWPKRSAPDFVQGVQLAADVVNRNPGPLAGKLRVRVFTEDPMESGATIADRVARDSTVVAVLGHATADQIVPASIVYERHGIVFLTPQGGDPRSTSHQFQYVFRFSPGDVQVADAVARYAAQAGLSRVGLVYARTEHGASVARQFGAKAAVHGVRVAFTRSYHHARTRRRLLARHRNDFRPLAAEVREQTFDALVIVDDMPEAGALIQDLDEMGVTQPIIATESLDAEALTKAVGAAAERVLVANAFEPVEHSPEYEAFRAQFEERFGVPPNYAAMQGFDALMLIANACTESETAMPLAIATTIRFTSSWEGLAGRFSFTRSGEVLGREIAVNRVHAGGVERVFSWEGVEE